MRISDWSSDVCSSDLVMLDFMRPDAKPSVLLQIGIAMRDLKPLLDDLTRIYDVPGAALAVWADGRLMEAAAGVVNLETRVPTTSDTLFQIGSITKLCTAVLCLQLVEEGKLSLDEPVRRWLPDFALRSEEHTSELQSLMRIS